MKIYKYKIYAMGCQQSGVLELPKGSKILSAIEQRETIVLYALIDPSESSTEEYIINICPTGCELGDIKGDAFLDTVSLYNGSLMYHVFYRMVEG